MRLDFRGRRAWLWRVQGGHCVYCGVAMTRKRRPDGRMLDNTATIDHVVPRAKKGTDDANNLVLACCSCNRKKGQMTPAEWSARTLEGL